ncbi:hypothetical protein SODALDRAFT_377548 [Sodiomyces alkalinus F11]|uniref:Uncharacterized protein n=1 Tax=Sodiomyces alkalinus (strain CBS 110278 / VKM F-3762 / F11) TaxID=1314773 RepID=A0A3N2PYK3_SODAK|nr:hypothetical protein SODALDRAFT_377548 [Sodiomyces alkalinus F11]ROT39611.1 hypothetical protein SODALDRAFT_377548 [Sodiomyces alkalinus F11]
MRALKNQEEFRCRLILFDLDSGCCLTYLHKFLIYANDSSCLPFHLSKMYQVNNFWIPSSSLSIFTDTIAITFSSPLIIPPQLYSPYLDSRTTPRFTMHLRYSILAGIATAYLALARNRTINFDTPGTIGSCADVGCPRDENDNYVCPLNGLPNKAVGFSRISTPHLPPALQNLSLAWVQTNWRDSDPIPRYLFETFSLTSPHGYKFGRDYNGFEGCAVFLRNRSPGFRFGHQDVPWDRDMGTCEEALGFNCVEELIFVAERFDFGDLPPEEACPALSNAISSMNPAKSSCSWSPEDRTNKRIWNEINERALSGSTANNPLVLDPEEPECWPVEPKSLAITPVKQFSGMVRANQKGGNPFYRMTPILTVFYPRIPSHLANGTNNPYLLSDHDEARPRAQMTCLKVVSRAPGLVPLAGLRHRHLELAVGLVVGGAQPQKTLQHREFRNIMAVSADWPVIVAPCAKMKGLLSFPESSRGISHDDSDSQNAPSVQISSQSLTESWRPMLIGQCKDVINEAYGCHNKAWRFHLEGNLPPGRKRKLIIIRINGYSLPELPLPPVPASKKERKDPYTRPPTGLKVYQLSYFSCMFVGSGGTGRSKRYGSSGLSLLGQGQEQVFAVRCKTQTAFQGVGTRAVFLTDLQVVRRKAVVVFSGHLRIASGNLMGPTTDESMLYVSRLGWYMEDCIWQWVNAAWPPVAYRHVPWWRTMRNQGVEIGKLEPVAVGYRRISKGSRH